MKNLKRILLVGAMALGVLVGGGVDQHTDQTAVDDNTVVTPESGGPVRPGTGGS